MAQANWLNAFSEPEPQLVDPYRVMEAQRQRQQQAEAARALAEQRRTTTEQSRREQQTAEDKLKTDAELAEYLGTRTPEQPLVPGELYRIARDPTRAADILKGTYANQKASSDNEEAERKRLLTIVGGLKALPEQIRGQVYGQVVQGFVARGMDPNSVQPYGPGVLEAYERELQSPSERANADKLTERDPTRDLVNAQGVVVTPGAARAQHSPALVEYQDAVSQGYKGSFSQYQTDDANRKRPAAAGEGAGREPLVAIMGADGQPVLVPRSQAAGKRPASTREQGRPVSSADAGRIADLDTSLDDLKILTKELGVTGTLSKIGADAPNWVTDLTGWGLSEDAKSRQAVVDRVRQVIGKALEGGVLRKEDEEKYKKILPTIGDPPAVAKTKLEGLWNAIEKRKQTTLESLADANYDVTKFTARAPRTRDGDAASGGNVAMTAPDGRTLSVPAAKVKEMEALGAKRK